MKQPLSDDLRKILREKILQINLLLGSQALDVAALKNQFSGESKNENLTRIIKKINVHSIVFDNAQIMLDGHFFRTLRDDILLVAQFYDVVIKLCLQIPGQKCPLKIDKIYLDLIKKYKKVLEKTDEGKKILQKNPLDEQHLPVVTSEEKEKKSSAIEEGALPKARFLPKVHPSQRLMRFVPRSVMHVPPLVSGSDKDFFIQKQIYWNITQCQENKEKEDDIILFNNIEARLNEYGKTILALTSLYDRFTALVKEHGVFKFELNNRKFVDEKKLEEFFKAFLEDDVVKAFMISIKRHIANHKNEYKDGIASEQKTENAVSSQPRKRKKEKSNNPRPRKRAKSEKENIPLTQQDESFTWCEAAAQGIPLRVHNTGRSFSDIEKKRENGKGHCFGGLRPKGTFSIFTDGLIQLPDERKPDPVSDDGFICVSESSEKAKIIALIGKQGGKIKVEFDTKTDDELAAWAFSSTATSSAQTTQATGQATARKKQ